MLPLPPDSVLIALGPIVIRWYGVLYAVGLLVAYRFMVREARRRSLNETLILDALLGDASLFTRADEVEAAWRIVDPIIDAWIAGAEPEMPNYTSGTWGPEAADELLTREGRRWRRL